MKKIIAFGILALVSGACKKQIPREATPYTLLYPEYFGAPKLENDINPLTKEGVELGRRLFYEPLLSVNGEISCASCHKQSFNFADTARYSSGIYGRMAVRNTPHLANLTWNTSRASWTGKPKNIRQAIENAILDTLEMGSNWDSIIYKLTPKYLSWFQEAFPSDKNPIHRVNVLNALEQFVRTIVSYNSKYDQFLQGKYEPTESEKRGISIFFTQPKPGVRRGAGCGDCHSGHLTSFGSFKNNGISPVQNGLFDVTGLDFDRGRFKIPSLRNVELTAPYMHDGSLKTLEEVIEHYNSKVFVGHYTDPVLLNQANEIGNSPKLQLTNSEKQDLLNFLKMLTDTSILTDPKFGNPHN